MRLEEYLRGQKENPKGCDKREEVQGNGKKKQEEKKTYNTRDSLVITDPTTRLAIGSLSMGERTGSRVFYHL